MGESEPESVYSPYCCCGGGGGVVAVVGMAWLLRCRCGGGVGVVVVVSLKRCCLFENKR